ncbi:MAG: hypothetical protein ACTSSP_00215 [Candidatus Asgardarchaeia archaeon]
MKIRIGFVSNSSSTSYVLAVTRNFKLTDEKRKELFEEHVDWSGEEDITIDQIDGYFQDIIERLCSSGEVYEDDDEPPLFYPFITVFEDEILFTTIEAGPGQGVHINLLSDKEIEKTLKKMKKIISENDETSS